MEGNFSDQICLALNFLSEKSVECTPGMLQMAVVKFAWTCHDTIGTTVYNSVCF